MFWLWYNFCIDCLWYRQCVISSFFVWWLVHLIGILLKNFPLYKNSPGERMKSFIGVSLKTLQNNSDFMVVLSYFLQNSLHFVEPLRNPIWLWLPLGWREIFKILLCRKLLEQAGAVMGPIIADNPFGYSLFFKYFFDHIVTLTIWLEISLSLSTNRYLQW